MRKIICLFVAAILVSGCAGVPTRKNAQFDNYFQGPEKTVTLMPIEIKFYKITAGGVMEEMDEWDTKSDALFRKAIMDKLDPSPKIKIKILEEKDIDHNFKTFLDEQNGLYRAISTSIITHTYMEGYIFPDKLKTFDYTLGSELSHFNDVIPTDSLLFISGTRTYWTGGRVFLAVCGVLAGAATGVTVLPGSVPDWVSVSLVDSKTGNIIWFRYVGAPSSTVGDLRDDNTVSRTVDYLFQELIK